MEKLKAWLRERRVLLYLGLLLLLGAGLMLLPEKGTEAFTEAGGTTQTEQRLAEILSRIDGAGDTEVLIHENENGTLGVVVVCSGGDSLTVKSSVIQAVSTALQTEAENVEVFAAKGTEAET